MNKLVHAILLLGLGTGVLHAQEFDDIYYNPKKDKTVDNSLYTKDKQKKSNYIADFQSIDVDEYNRRGQYYESPVDTIGQGVQNDEDFVYTQKIQKFYNPTIVVDNADVLDDVLANSYGNVDIVFEGGIPYFSSIYGWPGYYNYYNWGYPYWSSGYSWTWGPSWAYGPSWSWGWGPSWAYGPSWSWGWGPSWAYGPSWSWGWGPSWGWSAGWSRPYYADYRPGGRQPNRPSSHWANNTRPGGNYNGGSVGHGGSIRPGYASTTARPTTTGGYNYHRGANNVGATGRYGISNSNTVSSGTTNNHRGYQSTTSTVNSSTNGYNGSTTNRYNGSTTNRYNNTTTTRPSNSTTNSYRSSGSSNRSYGGGSYGGARSGGNRGGRR
ncbi:MAG: hypothetical protein HDS79_02915 [Bacteroidales bacterium]|nr:hypothetical protein [Bacteroidales bacterium]